ncbi:MAG TPA: hypothetical protein VJI98_01060 [Candidatus Nanoarchaeia archaeon]|nr:hypothetical protein [Candidatus Nanoarchaeia archaeon]
MRLTKLEKTVKVIIIDDELSDVLALKEFLEDRDVEVHYFSDLDTGTEAIADSLIEGPYSAIICDNHFHDSGLVDYDPNFSGADLMRILSGASEDEYRSFVNAYFGDDLQRMIDTYSGRLIMFSGSAYTEALDLSSRLEVVQKFPDRKGVCCESGVLDALERIGVELDVRDDSDLESYKQGIDF